MKKNTYYYIGANPTVDLIIVNSKNEILLIQRPDDSPACGGMWALPGGFIDSHAKKGEIWTDNLETPEQAALRELQEETCLVLNAETYIKPVGIYEGNQRDPRDNDISWSKSHAFIYQMSDEEYERVKDTILKTHETKDIQWVSSNDIDKLAMAFDHAQIIKDGLSLLNVKKSLKKGT